MREMHWDGRRFVSDPAWKFTALQLLLLGGRGSLNPPQDATQFRLFELTDSDFVGPILCILILGQYIGLLDSADLRVFNRHQNALLHC